MRYRFFSILFLTIIIFPISAQKANESALYKTILQRDSLLFKVGFNTCDISQFDNLLSENFEFFHDKDSISTKKQFIYNLRNGLCISPSTYQSRRELMKESTEIYPLYMKNVLYGAIQNGVHNFYEKINNKPETYASTAKFTNVWLLENKEWKLARSLSFDHLTGIQKVTKNEIFENESEIEAWLDELKIPTLGIGLINEGKLQQIKMYGEIKKGIKAPYNTLFNVASLTKPITALVALKLVSAGKWSLDEPVYKYWTDPDLAKDPRHKLLTTRLILSHQTGFPNWRWMNKDGKLNFEFTPGTKYNYSGEGLEYLRKALESKFHKTLDQLANNLIFKPLQMNDTEYFWTKNTDSTKFAIGYNEKGIPYQTIKNKTANGADDMLTTIEDYGKFLISVMDGVGLSKNVFNEMVKPQVASGKGKSFGLGFEIYTLQNEAYALSHGGSDKGAQMIVFMLPKTKQGLLIFTNADNGYKVYEKLIQHFLGENGKMIYDIEMKE